MSKSKKPKPTIERTWVDARNVVDTEQSLQEIENPEKVNFAQAEDTGCLYKYTGTGKIYGWIKLVQALPTRGSHNKKEGI